MRARQDKTMLIFLDLETTGLEANDTIVSIGIIGVEETKEETLYELLNEGKKIPPKASSIHHITNEMIKGKGDFKSSLAYAFLNAHNDTNATLIAHNVKFDLQKLLFAGLDWQGKIIDTLRVTKHLIPECEFFSLQILRYELKLYHHEPETIIPHNALGDAQVVKSLYNYLLDLASFERMCALSFEKVLLQKLEFGKYAGRYIEEIVMSDRPYIEWMLSSITDLDDDLRYSIMSHL
ncbi:MAG: exonuclease domain-containing protein [Sulfurimonas sp.]|jgi:DNA polymerase-3 subunit epsilon/exodeoxyribonuclease X|nr:exonuclease domain-containing protein [Sulfurimonas sp.]MDD5201557.1 exonuclease domain-containing protein [Sulfurimonas sp.]